MPIVVNFKSGRRAVFLGESRREFFQSMVCGMIDAQDLDGHTVSLFKSEFEQVTSIPNKKWNDQIEARKKEEEAKAAAEKAQAEVKKRRVKRLLRLK